MSVPNVRIIVVWALFVAVAYSPRDRATAAMSNLELKIACEQIFSPQRSRIDEVLRESRRVLFHPYKSRNFIKSIQTFRPRHGVGNLIVIEFTQTQTSSLLHAVLAFPGFFARYEMYASGRTLVIPDSRRLSSVMRRGLSFTDVIFGKQEYSEAHFKQNFRQARIPMGTRGYWFHHDRLQEHLLGALFVAPWMIGRLQTYFEFDEALGATDLFRKNEKYRRFFVRQGSAGHAWDQLTSRLGTTIDQLSVGWRNESRETKIQRLAHDLLWIDQNLLNPQVRLFLDGVEGKLPADEVEKIRRLVQQTASPFLYQPITPEFARAEAEKILNELEGTK